MKLSAVIPTAIVLAMGLTACTQAENDQARADAERTRVEARETAEKVKVQTKDALHDAGVEAKKAGHELNEELLKAREKTRAAIHEHTRADDERR